MSNQITIKDIAKMCGCGVSTVSRALNNHPDINEETRNKIMSVVSEYNFVPNNSARNIRISDSIRMRSMLLSNSKKKRDLKELYSLEDILITQRKNLMQ